MKQQTQRVTLMGLAVLFAVGVAVRTDLAGTRGTNPGPSFYNDEPLLTTFDGYYYLYQARDLVKGKYNYLDADRGVPDGVARSWPPPLLSLLLAGIAHLTGMGLLTLGSWLPVLLGPLLIIPVYLTGQVYGGQRVGLLAASLVTMAPLYVFRTGLGRCDTDCLNVTLTLGTSYCFVCTMGGTARKRYVSLGCGVFLTGLFVLWWDQARAVAGLIAVATLAPGLLLFRMAGLRKHCFFTGIGLGAAMLLGWWARSSIMAFADSVWSKMVYVLGYTTSEYPDVGQTITEQASLRFPVIANLAFNNMVLFLLAVLGLGILIAHKRKWSVVLWPCLFVGVLGVFFAIRFLVFLIPLLSLGVAYLLVWLWDCQSCRRWTRLVCVLWFALVTGLQLRDVVRGVPQPKEAEAVVRSMALLQHFTPPSAVVWAWWDHGHAIRFFADRATVNDGGVHSGSRTTYSAWPLCATNERAAANFMRFYSVHGRAGIRRFVSATGLGRDSGFQLLLTSLGVAPDTRQEALERLNLDLTRHCRSVAEWISYLFPSEHRPLYLFLDDRTFRSAYWWHWFGTWSVDRGFGVHPLYTPLYLDRAQGPVVRCRDGSVMDTRRGVLSNGTTVYPLGSVRMFLPGSSSGDRKEARVYNHGSDVIVEWAEGAGYGVLTDTRTAETLFNKLFLRQQWDTRFFQPLIQSRHVWRVMGD